MEKCLADMLPIRVAAFMQLDAQIEYQDEHIGKELSHLKSVEACTMDRKVHIKAIFYPAVTVIFRKFVQP